MSVRGPAGRSSTTWRVLAAGLALAGAVSMVIWADRSSDPDTDPDADQGSVSTPAVAAPAPVDSAPVVAPAPVRVTIPDIDVSSALVRLGLQDSGEVEVPQEPQDAGWYRLGTRPGAVGSAVILGHVDSVDGPAVFFRLKQLSRGARIEVALEDGTTATFAVRSVRTYANEDFPAQRVYTSHGRRELNLITCGGAYDASRGGYQANVVVNAHWVAGART
ncbi:class F sortase [Nocardioides sp. W7]|uniref:class F sortase n=1 Tax=Nocardioides sp. W7 TaxID=2931390 RepID=UPI001FD60C25|nr:class F sortase [Nocardioides sp. W7]